MAASVTCACGSTRDLGSLLFCAACHEVRCAHPACTAEQPDVCYCPCCWAVVFPLEASKQGRCCLRCYACPVCSSGLRDAGDGRPLECRGGCGWVGTGSAPSAAAPASASPSSQQAVCDTIALARGSLELRSIVANGQWIGGGPPRAYTSVKRSHSRDAGPRHPAVKTCFRRTAAIGEAASSEAIRGAPTVVRVEGRLWEKKDARVAEFSVKQPRSIVGTGRDYCEARLQGSRSQGSPDPAASGSSAADNDAAACSSLRSRLEAGHALALTAAGAVVSLRYSAAPLRMPLRAMFGRRCRACLVRGETGILTSCNPAPLHALGAGRVPERGLAAQWFRKTSPAASLLPLQQLLPRGRCGAGIAAAAAAGNCARALQMHIEACCAAALLLQRAAGAEGAPLAVAVPVYLRLINPCAESAQIVAVVPLSPDDAPLAAAVAGGALHCALRFVDAAGGPATTWGAMTPPVSAAVSDSSCCCCTAEALRREVLGAVYANGDIAAGAASIGDESFKSVFVGLCRGFDEIGLGDDELPFEEEAAAAASELQLLLPACTGGSGTPCLGASLTRAIAAQPQGSAAPAIVRWKHTLTVAAELRITAMPAQGSSGGSALSPPPRWLRVRWAAVCRPADAALVERAGAARLSAAASARCGLVTLQQELRVPMLLAL